MMHSWHRASILLCAGIACTLFTIAGSAPTGAVLGIDLGSDNSVVAIARRKGVDIVSNEGSQRSTPSIISFGHEQRFIGEQGLSQRMSNVKNTVTSPKSLVGRFFQDEDFKRDVLPRAKYELTEGPNGVACAKVTLCGKERVFQPTQLVAMVLQNLKKIAQADHGSEVVDCVISVPVFFTEDQRMTVREAAEIAGLKCLRVINDNTATALAYGITKTDLPEDKARNVVFVDCGLSCLQVAVVAFKKGQLKVLSHSYDTTVGGMHVDDLLYERFAQEFTERFKVDARTNARASLRLRTQCEKLKKTLSANPVGLDTPINVECMMDDTDVSGTINRGELEEIFEEREIFGKLEATCQRAMSLAGLTNDAIDTVEVIGGSSRIPAFKAKISSIFGKDCSTTINAAESVARGCSLACAMLSPAFRVRNFQVTDWNVFPCKVSYKSEDGGCEGTCVIEQGAETPTAEKLTLKTTSGVRFKWEYDDSAAAPPAVTPRQIAEHKMLLKSKKGDADTTVRAEVGLDMNGCAAVPVCQLETVETVTVDPPKKKEEKKDDKAKKKGGKEGKAEDDKAADAEGDEAMKEKEEAKDGKTPPPPPPPQTKTITRLEKLVVETVSKQGLSADAMQRAVQEEFDMALQDRVVQETQDCKNQLEEYVYAMRDALSSRLKPFVDPQPAQDFVDRLNQMEDWLYGDGESAGKGAFVDHLKELRATGDVIDGRYRQFEALPDAFRHLDNAIQDCSKRVAATDAKFKHITEEERAEVTAKAAELQAWMQQQKEAVAGAPKTQTPPVTADDVSERKGALLDLCKKVMEKPKPAPPKPPPKETKDDGKDKKEEGKGKEGEGDAGAQDGEMKDEEEKKDQPAAEDAEMKGGEEDEAIDMERMD